MLSISTAPHRVKPLPLDVPQIGQKKCSLADITRIAAWIEAIVICACRRLDWLARTLSKLHGSAGGTAFQIAVKPLCDVRRQKSRLAQSPAAVD
jgi:hypothetical protein